MIEITLLSVTIYIKTASRPTGCKIKRKKARKKVFLLYLPGRECSRTGSNGHPCPQSTCGRTTQGWHQPLPKQLIS